VEDLRAWLQNSGYNQREIAAATGVDPALVYKIWAGLHRNPRWDTIRKLIPVLGFPPFEINKNHLVEETVNRLVDLKQIRQARMVFELFNFSQGHSRLLELAWATLKQYSPNVREEARVFTAKMIRETISSNPEPEDFIRIAVYHLYRFLSDDPSKDLEQLNENLVPGKSSPDLARSRIIGEVQNASIELSAATDKINSHIRSIEEGGDSLSAELSEVHCNDHIKYYGNELAAVDNLLIQFESSKEREHAPLGAYIPWVLRGLISRDNSLIFRLDEKTQTRLGQLMQSRNPSRDGQKEMDRLRAAINVSRREYSKALVRRLLS